MSGPNARAMVLVQLAAVVVGLVVLSACAPADQPKPNRTTGTLPPAAAVTSPDSGPGVSIVEASALAADGTDPLGGTGWSIEPGPSSAPPGAISATQALTASAHQVDGDHLDGVARPRVALVHITGDFAGQPAAVPLEHRLVWMVELDGVPIAVSRPLAATPSGSATGTVQWIIDAMTGKYLEARDWGQ